MTRDQEALQEHLARFDEWAKAKVISLAPGGCCHTGADALRSLLAEAFDLGAQSMKIGLDSLASAPAPVEGGPCRHVAGCVECQAKYVPAAPVESAPGAGRCPAVDDDPDMGTGEQCVLDAGHAGPHGLWHENGSLEQWYPRAPASPPAEPGVEGSAKLAANSPPAAEPGTCPDCGKALPGLADGHDAWCSKCGRDVEANGLPVQESGTCTECDGGTYPVRDGKTLIAEVWCPTCGGTGRRDTEHKEE